MSAIRRRSNHPLTSAETPVSPPVEHGSLSTPSPSPQQAPPSPQSQSLTASPESPPISSTAISTPPTQQQVLLYHFAETWAMRKALNMPNRLTAYALLVDSHGQVRWRATGFATADEIKSLRRATRLLVSKSAQAAALKQEGRGSSIEATERKPEVDSESKGEGHGAGF